MSAVAIVLLFTIWLPLAFLCGRNSAQPRPPRELTSAEWQAHQRAVPAAALWDANREKPRLQARDSDAGW